MWRSRSENLTVHGGIELRDDIITQTDLPFETDRTRVFTIGATYDLADRWLGVNLADFSISQGVPLLGATRENAVLSSHPAVLGEGSGANPGFTKFDGELSRLQQVFPEWNVLAATSGQYSFSRLLTSEQFSYGGEQYGRAYDPSELLGDRGIDGKLEIQYTPAWAAGMFGWEGGVRSLQFYSFVDGGKVWSSPRVTTNNVGSSAGGGVRYTITDYLAGYIEIAAPLDRAVQSLVGDGQSGRGPRVFFSIAAKY
jgi:hemolysin activation/secretion protein